MKRIPTSLLALIVVALIFAALQVAGVLGAGNAVEKEVVSDIQQADRAFDTIDIQQAMGVVTFDPPQMLNPPDAIPPLMLYPPSAADLEALSGV